jgi:lysosomal acid phosphatase
MKTKFFMYSAHDTTLVNVLNTLGLLDLQIPPYSSAFIMELHKKRNEDGFYFVNILYRNETEKVPYKMVLPNCTFDCGYQQFTDFVRPFSVTSLDWDQECVVDGGGGGRSISKSLLYLN